MSLDNLEKMELLERHETDGRQVGDLLAAMERSLADAKVDAISAETRFDAAYRVIMNGALLALWANGYRPIKSKPGHHQLMIQALVKSIGIGSEEMSLLDTFRVKRNAIDYTGEMIDETSLEECIEAAGRLRTVVIQWLATNRPDLIK